MTSDNDSIYPERYETTYVTTSGEQLLIRPVKPTDEPGLQELYYSLSEEDVYLRFFSAIKDFGHERVRFLVDIDYSTSMVLVCEHVDENGETKIIGGGSFFKTCDPSEAEISFTINEKFRNQGIATFLLQRLIQIAQEQGYQKFVGSILFENHAMLHVIQNAGYPVEIRDLENLMEFTLDISSS